MELNNKRWDLGQESKPLKRGVDFLLIYHCTKGTRNSAQTSIYQRTGSGAIAVNGVHKSPQLTFSCLIVTRYQKLLCCILAVN